MTQPPPAEEFPPAAHPGPRRVDGRWIVAAIVALAIGLGLIGLKFRRPSPAKSQPSRPNAPIQTAPSR